ncbi:MerR family transcriptional regulator [Metabacillus fastidiosus]|uniref:MerR family transcriptional regulator n=1 Tax=Metabacillus fastidiosus TaxID=1458 RepID=UPI003D29D75E
MNQFTIGEIAKIAGISTATVRYYEKRGLITLPSRTESGYRMFSSQTVEEIKLIKRAQHLGFTLEEVKKILLIYKTENYFPTQEMYNFSVTKIKETEEKIAQLITLKSLLQSAINQADSKFPSEKDLCPVFKTLSKGDCSNG